MLTEHAAEPLREGKCDFVRLMALILILATLKVKTLVDMLESSVTIFQV